MAYQIRYTDTTKTPITVEDNTIDETTGLNFPGRNVTGYGQIIAENFLHLLENFASNTPPTKATLGQLWYDNNASVKQLKVYDGISWVAAGGLKKGAEQPDVSRSLQGDLWVNTSTQQLYLFTGATWILIGPRFSEGSRTGSEVESLEDTLNNTQLVIVNYVNGERIAIFSRTEFTPKIVLEGFAKIYKGTTLNSNYDGFFGTAEKSKNLLIGTSIVSSENFLRSDVVTNNYKGINVKANSGIQIGEDGQLQLGVDNNIGVIYQKTSGSSLDIRVNNQGILRSVLRVDSNERVGINNPSPAETLDVFGNVIISRKPNDNSQTGIVRITSNENSTAVTNGSLVVTGGVGISGNLFVAGEVNNSGTLKVTNILPLPNQQTGSSIGAQTSPFSTIWSNTIRSTSSYANNFYGALEGSVNGPATSLSAVTTFSIIGDIVSNEVEFNGKKGTEPLNVTNCQGNGVTATISFAVLPVPPFQAGDIVVITEVIPFAYNGTFTVITGTTSQITVASAAAAEYAGGGKISPSGGDNSKKRFITKLADNFVFTKPVVDGLIEKLDTTDEVLLSRTIASGNDLSVQLKKITVGTLFSNVPKIPIGSIMPYAGKIPPVGWLLCDGSEISKTKYQLLFETIGYIYGDSRPFDDTLSGVVAGNNGQFTCAANELFVNDQITISGTLSGSATGTITGYSNPKIYKISVTNGTTSFTLVNLDGSLVSTSAGTLTGLTFKKPGIGLKGFNTFRLPDLRGRFALGADNMQNDRNYSSSDKIFTPLGVEVVHPEQANRVLDIDADIDYFDPDYVNKGGGKELHQLTVNNLPQHEHTLQGSAGAQYGVFSDQLLTDQEAIIVKGLGGADNQGRLLQRSGNIRNYGTQEKINLMNPFLAINYIIYTGLDVSI